MDAQTLGDLVPLFLAWCREHRSAATERFYRMGLRVLVERLGSRVLAELRQHEIESALIAAGKRPDGSDYAPDTRRRNIIAFQVFQTWCGKNRYLKKRLCRKLEKPTGTKRDRIPTESETRRILQSGRPDFKAIYAALRQCGARPNELCRATIADWNRTAGTITLAEHKTARKTGKPRVIPVGKRFADLLAASVGQRTEGPIFLRSSGEPWTTQTLSATFRRLRNKLRLPRDLVLYLTRHEHGTKLLAKLKDIKAVADALGHADIKTTQRYVHKTTNELRANQDLVDLDAPPASDAPATDGDSSNPPPRKAA